MPQPARPVGPRLPYREKIAEGAEENSELLGKTQLETNKAKISFPLPMYLALCLTVRTLSHSCSSGVKHPVQRIIGGPLGEKISQKAGVAHGKPTIIS